MIEAAKSAMNPSPELDLCAVTVIPYYPPPVR